MFATTLAVACSGLVSIRNEAAARAYERAGFRWLQVLQDPLLGPSWLMLKERPEPRKLAELARGHQQARYGRACPRPGDVLERRLQAARRSPCAARQASVPPAAIADRVKAACTAASWLMAWAMARRSY